MNGKEFELSIEEQFSQVLLRDFQEHGSGWVTVGTAGLRGDGEQFPAAGISNTVWSITVHLQTQPAAIMTDVG